MKKSTVVLGIALVVLVGIAFLVLQKPGEQSVSGSEERRLVDVDSAAVDKIEVRSSHGAVTMEKRGAEWFIALPLNVKADQVAVMQLVQQVKDVQVKNVVSTKPEKHAIFQVDTTGTSVRIFERGTEKAAFILGKAGTAWTESYVRKEGSDEVILAEGLSGYTVNKPLRDWRDKNIVTVAADQIKSVRFQFGDTLFTLAKPDSVWRIGGDGADDQQVQSLIRSLSSVQADDFVDTTLSPAPKFTTSVAFNGIQLQFGFSKTSNKYFVLSSNSPQAYVMEPWRADQILKRKKDLLKK